MEEIMVRKNKRIFFAAALVAIMTSLTFGQYPAILKVEMQDIALSATNQTQPRLKISNSSTLGSISGFTVRLWFSKDEMPSQTIVVDKYFSNPAGIAFSMEASPIPSMPNVSAVKIVYPATFTLGPGASTNVNDVQFAVHFQNWGTWVRTNDWSAVGIGAALSTTLNVTVYNSSGVLVYGNEPTSATCPPGAPALKVEIRDNAPGDISTSSPRIKITNLSTCAPLAAGFNVKFWFSKEEFPAQTIVADKWFVSPSGITLSVGNHATNPNIKFVQATYPAGYTLPAGQATDPEGLQLGVHFLNYYPGVWNKTNDWSWQGITTTLAVTTHVTVYDNANNLIYGTEP
jgi:hypothetical protein